MLLRIARKELRVLGRDRSTVVVLTIYVAILALSCVAYGVAWSRQLAQQRRLHRQAREEWLTQTTSSPHQATHHGTTIYKLPSPLASFDLGVASEVGTAVKLESHRRHEATSSIHEDQIRVMRLDFTTPALLMQTVLPLVVIVLSHGIISRERELGTWNLLASLGISRRRFILGKLATLFFLIVLLSAPVFVSLLWVVLSNSTVFGGALSDLLVRAAVVYAVNLLYLMGWCAAGTGFSARYSSAASLIILLSCWAGWTLVIPRLAVDLAYSRFPLPSQQSQLERRETSIREGTDGRSSLEKFNADLEAQLLQEYGVTELQDLPIDLNAARLLAAEEFTNSIDDHAQWQIANVHRKQSRFLDWFELASPYLAIRSVSSSFAGTDRQHYAAFLASTERYRRVLVKMMNTAEMKGERPGPTKDSARRFWNQVPEFQQSFPSLGNVSYAKRWPIGLLVAWLSLTLMFALLPSKGGEA